MSQLVSTVARWKLCLLLTGLVVLNIASQGYPQVSVSGCGSNKLVSSETGEELQVTVVPSSIDLDAVTTSDLVKGEFQELSKWTKSEDSEFLTASFRGASDRTKVVNLEITAVGDLSTLNEEHCHTFTLSVPVQEGEAAQQFSRNFSGAVRVCLEPYQMRFDDTFDSTLEEGGSFSVGLEAEPRVGREWVFEIASAPAFVNATVSKTGMETATLSVTQIPSSLDCARPCLLTRQGDVTVRATSGNRSIELSISLNVLLE